MGVIANKNHLEFFFKIIRLIDITLNKFVLMRTYPTKIFSFIRLILKQVQQCCSHDRQFALNH